MTVFLLLFVLLTLLLVMYWLKLPPFFHERYEADRYVIGYDYGEGTDTSCAVVINRETGEIVDVIWHDDVTATIPSSAQLIREWEEQHGN